MPRIYDIYKITFMHNDFSYAGCFRNQKKFNINDLVYFTINKHDIFPGRIIGIELTLGEGGEYLYKIELPERVVSKIGEDGKYKDSVILDCESIFYTPEEAKKSAIEHLDKMYRLQKEQIDNYFSQFIR